APECAEEVGGEPADWLALGEAWGSRFAERLQVIAAGRLDLRIRMLGGTHIGYARLTRKWWAGAHTCLAEETLAGRPTYFVSSNTHALANLVTGLAREREEELVRFVECDGADD